MKVAVTIAANIPSQYANSINTIKHASAFLKLGYEVEFMCVLRSKEEKFLNNINDIFTWYGIDPLTIKFFKDKSIFYYQEEGFLGKCIRVLNKLTFGVLKNFNDPEKEISNYIQKEKFDICYCRSYRIVNYNIKNKIPTIVESHASNPFNIKEIKDFIKNANSQYFKGIVTIHEKLKDNFIKMGMPNKKVFVYEDAVDLDIFNHLEDDKDINRKSIDLSLDKKIVLYSGSLKKGKGIHIILDIAKHFKVNKEILFVLVGGSEKEILAWKKYYNAENILYKGFQEGKIIPTFLKSADILIMPYDTNDTKMVMDINTTSPIKLFEYMASKRPIISTNIEVVSKVLKHKEEILLADSFSDYINFINDILILNKYPNIQDEAFKKVDNFTYKTRCKLILNKLNKKI